MHALVEVGRASLSFIINATKIDYLPLNMLEEETQREQKRLTVSTFWSFEFLIVELK